MHEKKSEHKWPSLLFLTCFLTGSYIFKESYNNGYEGEIKSFLNLDDLLKAYCIFLAHIVFGLDMLNLVHPTSSWMKKKQKTNKQNKKNLHVLDPHLAGC